MNKIITIGREFGSGGREAGRRIAELLGIAYYDREIITEIAPETETSKSQDGNSSNITLPQRSIYRYVAWTVSVFAILVIAYFGRHGVKTYTDYVCMEYYLSGQADDYREQIALQRSLMQQEGVDDVILPGINNEQGPLMQMPVVSDPDNIDNQMTAAFYGKNSCRSIPRDEWQELYGE